MIWAAKDVHPIHLTSTHACIIERGGTLGVNKGKLGVQINERGEMGCPYIAAHMFDIHLSLHHRNRWHSGG